MAKSVKDIIVDNIIKELKADGQHILDECLQERDYANQSFNLQDSYGFAIYKFGQRVFTKTTKPVASEPKKWYGEMLQGSKEIESFFQAYQPGKTIELVIAAAMPYAEVLENASSGQLRKYKVVSMSYDKLRQLSGKYGNASVSAIFRGAKQ